MEQPIISGIAFNRDEAKLTIRGVPDTPGVAFKYFSPIGPIQVNLGYNHYQRADGPVYFDRFDPTSGLASKLICVSGTDASGQCASVAAIPRPKPFLKRLTLTVAFPPDF